ncbi:unnamed protein product, partial [Ectocarpus sp. 12 AP-2014]
IRSLRYSSGSCRPLGGSRNDVPDNVATSGSSPQKTLLEETHNSQPYRPCASSTALAPQQGALFLTTRSRSRDITGDRVVLYHSLANQRGDVDGSNYSKGR